MGVVSASLGRLAAAVKGEVPLLEETEVIYQALVADTVPRVWQVGVVSRIVLVWLCTIRFSYGKKAN